MTLKELRQQRQGSRYRSNRKARARRAASFTSAPAVPWQVNSRSTDPAVIAYRHARGRPLTRKQQRAHAMRQAA